MRDSILAFRANMSMGRATLSDMIQLLQTPVGRVRWLGALEGISFLLLLGIAVPLKYLAGQPKAVSIVGMAHGMLFIAYVLVLLLAWIGGNLSLRWTAIAFFAAFLPFGPFVIDRKLARFDPS